MAAICGIYNKNKIPVLDINCDEMMQNLSKFPHDTSNTWKKENVSFGSLNIQVTQESKYEILPRYINQYGLAITADAIIDNRVELISIFGIAKEIVSRTTDSELIVEAYMKWGVDCPKYLVGDFAFAIWDEKNQELFCARDHVGKRTFYYYLNSCVFAFCTLTKPLLSFKEGKNELDEEWIANYLSIVGPLHELNLKSTIFKDIKQLPPAHSLHITQKGVKLTKYWNPLKVARLKLGSNQEYEEAFRKVFSEAVNCRLRGINNIGIMLSGGLDSGSIACLAADRLSETNKRLKAYTSIPFAGYKNWVGKYSIADEREYIQPILDMYNNIDIKFCDSDSHNSYNSLDRLMELLEHPFKFSPNFFWIDEIASQSSKDGCSVLLDGQAGNFTISFGSFTSYICTLISKGKWIKAFKDIKIYSSVGNRDYKSVIKYLLMFMFPNRIVKFYQFLKKRKMNDFQEKVPINSKFAKLWKTKKTLRKHRLGEYAVKLKSVLQIRRFISRSLLFSQGGEAETKLSLEYGILKRDPTRDKRVIEFCMSLPVEQFVTNGIERSMIRRAMKGILPDTVRMNQSVRGMQSADWIQRIQPVWNEIKKELLVLINKEDIEKYIDKKMIITLLNSIELLDHEIDYEVQTIMGIISIGRFIDNRVLNNRYIGDLKGGEKNGEME